MLNKYAKDFGFRNTYFTYRFITIEDSSDVVYIAMFVQLESEEHISYWKSMNIFYSKYKFNEEWKLGFILNSSIKDTNQAQICFSRFISEGKESVPVQFFLSGTQCTALRDNGDLIPDPFSRVCRLLP